MMEQWCIGIVQRSSGRLWAGKAAIRGSTRLREAIHQGLHSRSNRDQVDELAIPFPQLSGQTRLASHRKRVQSRRGQMYLVAGAG